LPVHDQLHDTARERRPSAAHAPARDPPATSDPIDILRLQRPADILRLQRTAGNASIVNAIRALHRSRRDVDARGVQRRDPPAQADSTAARVQPKGRNRMLQRNVGFEFELGPSTKLYQYSYLRGYEPLSKRDRVLDGTDFYVEADYLSGGNSSWEFVTKDFPETGPGLLELQEALMNIDGIVALLSRGTLTRLNGPHVYNPVHAGFGAYGTVVPNRYFKVTDTLVTKPQVTAGFDLAALNALFRSAASAPGPGVSNLVRDVGSMNEFGKVAAPQVDLPLGAMWAAAATAIAASYGGAGAPAGGAAAESLQALVTQAMQMIIGGQQPVGVTPKTLLRLVLHRTDFKEMFNRLPNPLRTNIEAVPATFVAMVMGAVNTITAVANNSPVISANLFTDPSMIGDPHYNTPSPFTQVSCDQWLTAIATPGGSDLLSAGLYPVRSYYRGFVKDQTDVKANEMLGSMGALHNKLDPGNRPIFEIRSSKQIHAGLIPAYALDFFKYVRYLHDPAALTETSFLTGLTQQDILDLIGFTPNRPAVVGNLQSQSFGLHGH
jgi:hypothetical protein